MNMARVDNALNALHPQSINDELSRGGPLMARPSRRRLHTGMHSRADRRSDRKKLRLYAKLTVYRRGGGRESSARESITTSSPLVDSGEWLTYQTTDDQLDHRGKVEDRNACSSLNRGRIGR